MRRIPVRRARITLIALLCAGLAAGRAASQDTTRLTLAPGDTIALTVSGTGPSVIVVPGLLGSSFSFRHVTPGLVAAGMRVTTIDPLGTGASSRPGRADYSLEAQAARVEAVMDSLGIRHAVLVCHSVGASICYRLALRAPDRVRGIVSINGGPDERAATSGLRLALKFAPLIRLFGGAGRIRGRVKDGLRDSAGPDRSWVTEDVVDAYAAPYANLDATLRALRGMASAEEPEQLAPRLPGITAPVTLLIGAGNPDASISPEDLGVLTDALPALRVDSIAGAGQYVQEENPDAVVAAVRSLLQRVVRADPPR